MQLHGFHHVTAITADAGRNHHFYTEVLGMRLVKKTVNQDDVAAYHLFYADGKGSPGTDLTFFDWPLPRERRGANSVGRVGFRIGSEQSLTWWHDRLTERKVSVILANHDGKQLLEFEDPEGQRFCFVVDPGERAHPWEKSPVPAEHQVQGLGRVTLVVSRPERTAATLENLMNMRRGRIYKTETGADAQVFEMAGGGSAARELHLVECEELPQARQGAGAVHHVAFRTTQSDYGAWAERLMSAGVPYSGPVDRFYFRSLYFREPNGILFEIATDEPGFTADEPLDQLGQNLSLPPFLEPRRAEIEAGLKPLH